MGQRSHSFRPKRWWDVRVRSALLFLCCFFRYLWQWMSGWRKRQTGKRFSVFFPFTLGLGQHLARLLSTFHPFLLCVFLHLMDLWVFGCSYVSCLLISKVLIEYRGPFFFHSFTVSCHHREPILFPFFSQSHKLKILLWLFFFSLGLTLSNTPINNKIPQSRFAIWRLLNIRLWIGRR